MAARDRMLVRKALSGDQQAFGDLVERYERLVHGLILETVRRPDETEDLVQEVFCAAYEKLASLRDPACFAGWLARMASNTAIQWLRHHQVRDRTERTGEYLLPLPEKRPDEMCEEREEADYLWKALDRLPPEHRRVVVLHHLEGCTYQEIGRFVGISRHAVRWRLKRAQKQLAVELGEIVGQETLRRTRDRRSAREKILIGLPVVAFFRPERRPWWSRLEGWRRLLPLGCAGLLGVLGIVRWRTSGEGSILSSGEVEGLPVHRIERVLPEVSVSWEPRRPRSGEGVRIEAAGERLSVEGARAFLHYMTHPDYPEDKVVPMQREEESWAAELAIPDGAKAVFFYVSGEEQPQVILDSPWSPGQAKWFQPYRWSFLVHDEQGRPVRDAEFMVAEMGLLSGRPFREVRVHLDRETDRYPDNVRAHNERWFHAMRIDSASEARVRKEQRALMARFVDRPEVLFAIGRYAGPLLPESYPALRERFPEYERTGELAYLWAGFYGMAQDTVNQIALLEEVIHSFPESRYAGDAHADLLRVLTGTQPERAARLADALIDGKVQGGRNLLRRRGGETVEGRAYRVRFELFLREGDGKEALKLAERLVHSGLEDPSPYRHIGNRLSGGSVGWFEENVVCPRDRSLGTRVLEAGLPWVALERLSARLATRDATAAPASVRERMNRVRARRERRAYLKCLGRYYLAQEQFREATVRLQEVVDLQAERDRAWGRDEVHALLGEALEGMGDREGAWNAYEQAWSFTGDYPPAEEALARLYAEKYGDLEGFEAFLWERRPQAPEFALADVLGGSVRLSDFAGRPVLLFYERFFYKPFDDRVVPSLEEWQRRFGKNLVVVYIGAGRIDRERFGRLAGERAGGLRVALDDGSVYEQYGPGYRELFLIDRSGKLRWRRDWRGEEPEEIARAVGEVVAETGEGRRNREMSDRWQVGSHPADTTRH